MLFSTFIVSSHTEQLKRSISGLLSSFKGRLSITCYNLAGKKARTFDFTLDPIPLGRAMAEFRSENDLISFARLSIACMAYPQSSLVAALPVSSLLIKVFKASDA
jgi:hypothetical protein